MGTDTPNCPSSIRDMKYDYLEEICLYLPGVPTRHLHFYDIDTKGTLYNTYAAVLAPRCQSRIQLSQQLQMPVVGTIFHFSPLIPGTLWAFNTQGGSYWLQGRYVELDGDTKFLLDVVRPSSIQVLLPWGETAYLAVPYLFLNCSPL